MNNQKSEQELIELAKSTNNIEVLTQLSRSQYSNVRRVVAKNYFTQKEIINKLAFDPVRNVSYVASNNTKCTIARKFDSNSKERKCVICTIPEERYQIECKNCKNNYY